jgi:hypothetical protein
MTTSEITTTDILDVPGEYYGDHVDDYDHDAIRSDYRDAIQELLPAGVVLALNGQVFAELDVADEARAINWAEIAEAVDFDAIVARHDRASTQITADHIRDLHAADFGTEEAVLVRADGEVQVWTHTTATDHGVEIITTASDVWEYCDGELDGALAAQLAADLTAERQGRL